MGLMAMAQHRQAPRQFKEEPGHDSVSDNLGFPFPLRRSTQHRRIRHCVVICQCGSAAERCQTRAFESSCTLASLT